MLEQVMVCYEMLELVMECCEMLEQVMECCEMLKSHMTRQVCYAPRSVHPKNNRDSTLFHQISHASIKSML